MSDNLHPADELLALRGEIKTLQDRADACRTLLIEMKPAEREGRGAYAEVIDRENSRLDMAKIRYEMGQKWIDQHSLKTPYKLVKVESL